VNNSFQDCVLRARGIRKSFSLGSESLDVLKGIDMDLPFSSSLSIRGDSGCGKSTLLNLLARLEPSDEGKIFWGDREIDAARKLSSVESKWRAKHIGVVYQSYYLIPELTVMENVLMSLRIGGLSLEANLNRANELLSAMGMESKANQIPSKLSGGERQRVAIARALVNRPKVIFADEPTGNLDERTGGEVMDLLLESCELEAASLILVTHNPDFARAAHKSMRLRDGLLFEE